MSHDRGPSEQRRAPGLLGDEGLERSAVVANCRMNRERDLAGSNGYGREVGFNPLDFLRDRAARGRTPAWLDLCCGTGKALIQAAGLIHAEGLDAEIIGVDLIGTFHRPDPTLSSPRLVEASLSTWRPDRRFDLITCVHGLHYVGDKLGLVARAASWLVEDGLLVANLDLCNLKFANGKPAGRRVAVDLRRSGLEYDRRRRRVVCRGRKVVDLPYDYLGADDGAGPNYTGQAAVDSYYERIVRSSRSG
jgi:SAM-dependent methyltransferase